MPISSQLLTKAVPAATAAAGKPAPVAGEIVPRPRIALLSNPRSTGNIAQLPRIRAFCAAHTDVFHYEVEKADQVAANEFDGFKSTIARDLDAIEAHLKALDDSIAGDKSAAASLEVEEDHE